MIESTYSMEEPDINMQTPEMNLYVNFTKSIVDGFDEFIIGIEKHGCVVRDSELKQRLKNISKKLQTIFNRWENTPDNKLCTNSSLEEIIIQREAKNATNLSIRSDSLDDFESIIASSVGDKKPVSKITATGVIGNSKSEFSILDTITNIPDQNEVEISNFPPVFDKITEKTEAEAIVNKFESLVKEVGIFKLPLIPDRTTTLTEKEKEIIRKFEIENVKEEWIRGSKGFYIVESSPGSWKCDPCKLEALSSANIISHASGKSHMKKIDIHYRDTSQTRQNTNDSILNFNLSRVIPDTEIEAKKKKSSSDNSIVPFKGYYCKACCKNLNSEEDIKLHVNGGKHRKNIQS